MPEPLRSISTLDELESAIALSSQQPVVLFKHSASCGLSAQAFESVRELLDSGASPAAWFVISVHGSRAISAAVSARFNIRHESPQALVLVGGKVAWHGSHYRATSTGIVAAIEKFAAPELS